MNPHSPAFLTPLEGKHGLASAVLGNVLLHSEPPQSRLPRAIGLLRILFFCEIISNLPLFVCSNASAPILLPALYRCITWPPGCPILIPTFTRHLFKSQLCTERFSRWEQMSLWDNRHMKKAIQFVQTVRGSHLQGSLVGQTRKRSDASPSVGNRTNGHGLGPRAAGTPIPFLPPLSSRASASLFSLLVSLFFYTYTSSTEKKDIQNEINILICIVNTYLVCILALFFLDLHCIFITTSSPSKSSHAPTLPPKSITS